MATYTMELYKVIEVSPDGNIGLDVYPIWDDSYRETLNSKIINHYHNQEIGLETVDMFRFALRRRMAEVMPYYNELYSTTKLEFDPLSTIDMRTIVAGTSNSETTAEGQSTTTSENTGASRAVESAFPQNNLSGSGDYATGAADTNSKNRAEGAGSESASNVAQAESDTDSHTTGYQGVASDLVSRYRDTLLNIDLMIISELSDLFMMVWGNSDSYTPYPFTRFDSI